MAPSISLFGIAAILAGAVVAISIFSIGFLELAPAIRTQALPVPTVGGTAPCVLPGDVNANGVVNDDDLQLVRNNISTSGPGDVNGDGTVDLGDLVIVRNNLGTGCPSPTVTSVALVSETPPPPTPEPSVSVSPSLTPTPVAAPRQTPVPSPEVSEPLPEVSTLPRQPEPVVVPRSVIAQPLPVSEVRSVPFAAPVTTVPSHVLTGKISPELSDFVAQAPTENRFSLFVEELLVRLRSIIGL